MILRTCFRTGALLGALLLATSGGSALAGHPAGRNDLKSAEHLIRNEALAVRMGSESCWAKFSLHQGGTLCLSHEVWLKTLHPGQDAGFSGGSWSGKWKARSGPENELDSEDSKHAERVFQATGRTAQNPETFEDRIDLSIERSRERFSGLLSKSDSLGILRRLLLDERTPGTPLAFLRLLGFIHLFTASGIHLYSLARVTQKSVAALGQLLQVPAALAVNLSKACAVLMWLLAWLFTGMRAGMLRPWLLVVARMTAERVGFRWRSLSPLFISLSLDLGVGLVRAGFTCEKVKDWAPGRIHYALAVGGGFLALELFRGKNQKITRSSHKANPSLLMEHLALALGSWIFIALWDVWTFGWVALATPILSLLTLPILSGVIYPGTFLGILLNSGTICSFFGMLTTTGVGKLAEISLESSSLWMISRYSLALSALIAGCLIAGRAQFRQRAVHWSAGMIAALGMGWVLSHQFNHLAQADAKGVNTPMRALTVEQLDIGQGDAALIQLAPGTYGMMDVGSEKSLNTEAWLKIFGERGIRTIQWIGLSHLDEDHVGALLRLAPLIQIGCVATASEELHTEKAQKYALALHEVGVHLQSWESGCFPFPVHGPAFGSGPARRHGKAKDGNENMSAFWIPLQDGRAYFAMGDADEKRELQFLHWAETLRRPEQEVILKVSHHGSRFSTSTELLRALRPVEAWISAGVGNRHGHPTHATLELLENEKIKVRRTDLEGNLRLHSPQEKPR